MARLWRDYGAIMIYSEYMYRPRFSITPRMNTNIAEIERLRLLVEQSRILPTKEVVLRRRAAIEATRSSTGIEGNPLSIADVERVLAGKKVSAADRFITEVINYKRSLEIVERLAQNDNRFSLRDILGLHASAMRDLLAESKIGALRKTPVYVVDFVDGKQVVRYEGPQPQHVTELIADLLAWLHDEKGHIHPIIKAGIFHYEFVSIHPFADGNGRVTRLLTLLYLYQRGYAFRKVLVPDTYYFENRPRYYAALGQARTYADQRTADLTQWLEYFVEGIHVAAKDIMEKITNLSVRMQARDTLTLTQEDYRMIEFISTVGKATIEDIVASVDISKRTAQRRLSRLVAAGVLVRRGKGPATRYQVKTRK